MNLNLRYPNITGFSEKEQLMQIKSFLHQLVDQLNYADFSSGGSPQTYQVQGAEVSYYELKTLIMQEIQEVETLFSRLSAKMQSEYVPKSGWEADKDIVTDADGNVVASAHQGGSGDTGDGTGGSYIITGTYVWDEDVEDHVITLDNFDWDELVNALDNGYRVACRLSYAGYPDWTEYEPCAHWRSEWDDTDEVYGYVALQRISEDLFVDTLSISRDGTASLGSYELATTDTVRNILDSVSPMVTITADDVADAEISEQTGFADDENNIPTIYPIGIHYDSIYEALVQGGTVRIKTDLSFVENFGETPYPVETVVAYALTHQGLLLRTISNTIRYLFVNGSYHGDFTEEDNPWDITDA